MTSTAISDPVSIGSEDLSKRSIMVAGTLMPGTFSLRKCAILTERKGNDSSDNIDRQFFRDLHEPGKSVEIVNRLGLEETRAALQPFLRSVLTPVLTAPRRD